MVEDLGVAFPIAPLISQCHQISRTLRNVAADFKRVPQSMNSLPTECSLIQVALDHLRHVDWSDLDNDTLGGDKVEQMMRSSETVILGCTLTLSVVDEYACELRAVIERANQADSEQSEILPMVRDIWKDNEMRELLLQLRGYHTGLTTLLRAVHE